MKILFLLTQDLESPTGVGRYQPLAKYLAQLGHQVTIAALHADFSNLAKRSFFVDKVQVHYIAQMQVLKQNDHKIYFPIYKLIYHVIKATIELTRVALSTPADIIHVGKPHPMNSIAGLLARRFKKASLFLDYDDYEAASGHFKNQWQKKIVQLFEDWVPQRVDQVTTINEFLKKRLLQHSIPEKKITLLPNGVDPERFLPGHLEDIENLRRLLHLQNKKIVAFIGSLSIPSHPVDLLLDAYQCVSNEMAGTALLIVGGGEEIQNLQNKASDLGIADSTIFTGRVKPNEINLYYRLADVVVEPVHDDLSAHGRVPLKMFESWITGTPFITSDVGDRKQFLGEPPAGLLVQPGNARHLADGILKVLRNEELANILRERGLLRVPAYDWKNLASTVEKVYQDYSKLSHRLC